MQILDTLDENINLYISNIKSNHLNYVERTNTCNLMILSLASYANEITNSIYNTAAGFYSYSDILILKSQDSLRSTLKLLCRDDKTIKMLASLKNTDMSKFNQYIEDIVRSNIKYTREYNWKKDAGVSKELEFWNWCFTNAPESLVDEAYKLLYNNVYGSYVGKVNSRLSVDDILNMSVKYGIVNKDSERYTYLIKLINNFHKETFEVTSARNGLLVVRVVTVNEYYLKDLQEECSSIRLVKNKLVVLSGDAGISKTAVVFIAGREGKLPIDLYYLCLLNRDFEGDMRAAHLIAEYVPLDSAVLQECVNKYGKNLYLSEYEYQYYERLHREHYERESVIFKLVQEAFAPLRECLNRKG